jgi:hypothetical protein
MAGNIQLEKIDKIFTFKTDLFGDQKTETVTIHISGESIKSPFVWELIVSSSAGKAIYSAKRDDKWLNKFFGDRGYVSGCVDYITCKEKYYFNLLPNEIFGSLKKSTQQLNADDQFLQNVKDTAKLFLKNREFKDEKIDSIILEMTATIKSGKFISFEVPVSPVQDDPPMIWVKSINLFVPYYTD